MVEIVEIVRRHRFDYLEVCLEIPGSRIVPEYMLYFDAGQLREYPGDIQLVDGLKVVEADESVHDLQRFVS